jgi:hypothetical protein
VASERHRRGVVPLVSTERRASARAAVTLRVHVRTLHTASMLLTENIGRGGLFVRTDSPARHKELVEVTLDLEDGGPPVGAVWVVRHIVLAEEATPYAPPGMGLQLLDIRREHAQRITRLVEELTARRRQRDASVPPMLVEPLRRRHARVHAELAARVVGAGSTATGAVVDIGVGGALVRLASPGPAPSPGEAVSVELWHAATGLRAGLPAHVVRTSAAPGSPAIAVVFGALDRDERASLQQVIDTATPAELHAGDFLLEEEETDLLRR